MNSLLGYRISGSNPIGGYCSCRLEINHKTIKFLVGKGTVYCPPLSVEWSDLRDFFRGNADFSLENPHDDITGALPLGYSPTGKVQSRFTHSGAVVRSWQD